MSEIKFSVNLLLLNLFYSILYNFYFKFVLKFYYNYAVLFKLFSWFSYIF